MKDDDRQYMEMALSLAAKGAGFTSPNPMVGAVLVKRNRVVGKGYHEAAGGPHAEVNAIDRATEDPRGADLYVTLEPCNHTGKTPPCAEKVLAAGIKRVVTAMRDPNPDVAGGGNDYLRRHGVNVVEGVCEKEALRLNEVFVKFVQTRRPFTVWKCAATLDGRIAARTGDAKWISNEMSREYVHRLRHVSDAILVGRGTVEADNPSLTTRLENGINGKEGKHPVRIILDTRLSCREDAVVFSCTRKIRTLLVIGDTGGSPDLEEKKKRLSDKGVDLIESPLKNGGIDLDRLMVRLGEEKITSLLIEGGSRVIHSALTERVIDKIILFYGPKLLGGDDGIPMIGGLGPEKMSGSLGLTDMAVSRFGDDIMVSGYPVYPSSDS